MSTRQPSARRFALLFPLLLAGSLANAAPPAAAQPPARGYERTFRYPSPVPPLVETLAQAEWRERTLAAPAPEPAEEEEPINPALDLRETNPRLLPGATQSPIV